MKNNLDLVPVQENRTVRARLDLHDELCSILGTGNVYFQPPESVKLRYPCILYETTAFDVKRADDIIYNHKKRYRITCITKDPDDDLAERVLMAFQYCRYDRHFVSDNLYHDFLELYY